MKRNNWMSTRNGAFLAATSLLLLCGGAAHAQGGGGFGGPPPGFGGGPGGPGGMRPGGPGMGPRELTVVDLSVDLLARRLSLTDAQKEKIAQIEKGVRTQRDGLREQQQAMREKMQAQFQGARDGGTPPDPEAMRPQMEQMRTAQESLQTSEQSATKQIEQTLTTEQRIQSRSLLKDANLMVRAGLPYQALADVTLSDAERDSLTKLFQDARRDDSRRTQQMRNGGGPGGPGGPGRSPGGFEAMREQMQAERKARYEKALAVLGAENRSAVEAYVKAHPEALQAPPGGPMGGPGGGRGLGGPPPQ